MEKLLKLIFRGVLCIKGYQLHIVKSAEEERHVINFANEILSSEGYPETYLNMLTRYHKNSTLFVILHKKELIGSLRLFDPSGPCRIFDFWKINFLNDVPLSEYREMGSLVIDKRYRGKSGLAMIALLDLAYNYSKRNGITRWMASACQTKFQKFKRMNPSCRIIDVAEPSNHQLTYRTEYNVFFDKAKASVIFEFDLKGASYSHQFKRILRKKFKRKGNRSIHPFAFTT